MSVEQIGERLVTSTPAPVQAVIRRASDHHLVMLAGGLAFFGILSLAPALGVAFALLRLLLPPQAAQALVQTLSDNFQHTLALGDLLKQMEGKSLRYGGFSLLVLLWPATTLAAGWTRAMDAIHGTDAPAGRGLRGRVKGLPLGGVLLAGVLLMMGVMTYGVAHTGDRALAFGAVVLVAVLVLFTTVIVVYRWFPTDARPALALVWPGALWATGGLVLGTVVLALGLSVAGSLAQRYPPTLATVLVLGLWLYGANMCLLLGAEYNEWREQQRHERGVQPAAAQQDRGAKRSKRPPGNPVLPSP